MWKADPWLPDPEPPDLPEKQKPKKANFEPRSLLRSWSPSQLQQPSASTIIGHNHDTDSDSSTSMSWIQRHLKVANHRPRYRTSLLHGPTAAEHTAKRIHFWSEDSKNYDRNGPEGQFRVTGSSVCNEGLSLWYPCFLIQAYPIKVSMKKKRRELEQDSGRREPNL